MTVAMRLTSAILCGAAFLALLALQFLPWANVRSEGSTMEGGTYFGFTAPDVTIPAMEVRLSTWDLETRSGGREHDLGWYSDDLEDDDGDDTGLTLIRVAIPLLLAGLAAVLVGGLLTLLMRGIAGPVVALVGGVVATVGTILFANGVDEVFEGADYSWLAGLYVAILACALAVAGGVLGLLDRDEPVVGRGAGSAA